MQAMPAYLVGMSTNGNKTIQYTVRGVPEKTDRLLREKASVYGTSLNETALEVLQVGLGVTEERVFHDLDGYAGTWAEDSACEKALDDMRKVDMELWK